MFSISHRQIFGSDVFGVNVDGETRCAHHHGENDIVAIKFKCCGKWFSCHACHDELAGHAVLVWPKNEFDAPVILCGGCGHRLTANEYLNCQSICPRCRRSFNPGCVKHHHHYFEI